MSFSDAELDRYARHLVLREVGGAGQAALKAARVVVIGAGGIGSPALQYLAAAGVGTLVVIDDDRVDASNLQRQTLFADADIGMPKVAAVAAALARINPFVAVEPHALRIHAGNAADLLAGADVVVDGCDNFATRLVVADAALTARIPLVSAAVGQFEGQLGVFRGWEPHLPCYRCFVGDDPARADASCADQGVLGALTGIIGSMAALEAMRAIIGFGDDPAGRVLIADLLAFRFRTLTLPKDPGCRCAG
ncbi:HesA/MoeB/ThiF family protein [Sphingomonas hankookensis]|uniref:HesA/MoeB/ThiF family protein n=1 Tax=Sphingomonas hankookensis TaxID=563996 RepID=UPI001F5A01CE|nr:HesA/MoeB/ThiF family protein [Sphingomonas hankookensis]